MTIQQYTLTQTPIKISDGTKSTFIQELAGGGMRFACSATAPPALESSPFGFTRGGDISLPVGWPIWAWTSERDAGKITVVVQTAEF